MTDLSTPNLKLKINLKAKIGIKKPIAISLFSGAGGDTVGLTDAGYDVKYFSEFDSNAIETHKVNHPNSTLIAQNIPNGIKNMTDITSISNDTFTNMIKDPIELIFAGFPCQGFSNAGKKKENDPRNELVHQFVRVVDLFKPKWIIGENVRGLLSRKGTCPITGNKIPVIEIIEKLFNNIGYTITYNVINATDVGVPQLRKRLIIVGHRGSLYPNILWKNNDIGHKTMNGNFGIRHMLLPTLQGAIKALKYENENISNNITNDDSYWIKTTETECSGVPHPNLVRLNNGIRNLSTIEKKLPENLGKTHTIEPSLISFGKRKSAHHGEIVNPDQPCKTIICTYGTCPRLFVGLVDPTGQKWIRCLLPCELSQIQGFPADYRFVGNPSSVIKQIGNAVPPQIVKHICKQFNNPNSLSKDLDTTLITHDNNDDD